EDVPGPHASGTGHRQPRVAGEQDGADQAAAASFGDGDGLTPRLELVGDGRGEIALQRGAHASDGERRTNTLSVPSAGMRLICPEFDEPELLAWWRPLLVLARKARLAEPPWALYIDEFTFRGRVK